MLSYPFYVRRKVYLGQREFLEGNILLLRSSSYRSSRRKSNLRDFLLEPLCSACMIFFVKLQWGYPFAYDDKCPILHIGTTINTYAKPQGRCFPTITLSEKELPDNWVLANLTWFFIIIIITEFIVNKHLKIKEQKQWVVILWRLLQNEFFLIIKLWYKRAYGLE